MQVQDAAECVVCDEEVQRTGLPQNWVDVKQTQNVSAVEKPSKRVRE